MPEQPQWSDRTLDMPPQDPWADWPTESEPYPTTTPQAYKSPPAPTHPAHRPFGGAPTAAGPTAPQPTPQQPMTPVDPSPFSQGRAQVNSRTPRYAVDSEPEPTATGTGWPDDAAPARPQTNWRGNWRRGARPSVAAALFLFGCWGIWALSTTGSPTTALIVLAVTLAVAVGVFCLARVVGYLVLERMLHRTRRGARGSHLVSAFFLIGVGIGHLQQTQWVMSTIDWVRVHSG